MKHNVNVFKLTEEYKLSEVLGRGKQRTTLRKSDHWNNCRTREEFKMLMKTSHLHIYFKGRPGGRSGETFNKTKYSSPTKPLLFQHTIPVCFQNPTFELLLKLV